MLECRTFDHPEAQRLRQFIRVENGDFRLVEQFLKETEARKLGAFFGVALRTVASLKTRKGDAEHCQTLTALFVDADFKHLGEEETRRRLDAFPLPPSIVIHSGGGLHPYWLLATPLYLQAPGQMKRAKVLLKALAQSVAGVVDESVSEPVRVLRVPGGVNFKKHYDEPRPVHVEYLDGDARYTFEQIEKAIGAPALEQADTVLGAQFAVPQQIATGDRHDVLYRLLRSQKARGVSLEAAVACCHVENKAKCHPPIDEQELDDYLRRTWNQADSPTFQQPQRLFPATEAGDAEFFAQRNADGVRYDHRRGRYLVFDGHRWAPNSSGEVQRLALESTRARQKAALDIQDSDTRKRYLKWAADGETRNRLTNLLVLARDIHPIDDKGDSWDLDPWLLGVPNGVVNLRTGALRDGRPEDRITMQARVRYDPHATCPLWDQTIWDIFAGDQVFIDYIDRLIGYSITGDCREEMFALCWGGGGNGKGTLMNTLAWVLKDYADNLPFSTLEMQPHGGGSTNDLAKLEGKRFVTASETSESRRLNEARLKALTGRDEITARFLYSEWATFQPVAKFWLSTNPKPEVRDTSEGFWRRIHMIPFTQSFTDRPNLRLKDDLQAEAPGILARAVRGCLAWQREGLEPPPLVREATATYRTESLPLTEFLAECCMVQPGARATAGALFDAYQNWVPRGEERLGRGTFLKALQERFETDPRQKRNVTYLGVALMTLGEDEQR